MAETTWLVAPGKMDDGALIASYAKIRDAHLNGAQGNADVRRQTTIQSLRRLTT
jgi:hypothetical protein